MDGEFRSSGIRLSAHLSTPAEGSLAPGRPGLVLCHGFPSGPKSAAASGLTYPELADRIANDCGWVVLTFNFRGTGLSAGNFSLGGWLDDLRAAVDHLISQAELGGVWLCGASTGGSLAICAAAEDERVHGVAALSARADFEDWAQHPRRFLDHAREIGVIRDADFPQDADRWVRDLQETRPLVLAAKLAPRPLLLVQGSDDDHVPALDARALADWHGSAELCMIQGAGHRLRHDPRAVAVLLGWLDRQITT